MGLSVACAVLRGEPPTVFLAEDLDALHWTLATEVVARARDQHWPAPVREQVRAALLAERWADAVLAWMDHAEAKSAAWAASCRAAVSRSQCASSTPAMAAGRSASAQSTSPTPNMARPVTISVTSVRSEGTYEPVPKSGVNCSSAAATDRSATDATSTEG